jgi:hypothetical protein
MVMHPAWLALKSSKKILYSGNEIDAINAMKTIGTCGYDKVEESLNRFGSSAFLSGSALVNFIETYARELQKNADRDHAFDKAIDGTANQCPDDVIFERMRSPMNELSGTSVQIFNKLLAQTCPASAVTKYKIPTARDTLISSNAAGKQKLNELIEKGPFTIGYCANAWTYPDLSVDRTKDIGDDCGPHSSLVVGRKKIGDQCYSLVRNTWGTGWGEWNENSKCLCRHKTTLEWLDECTVDNQSSGEYTVEACYMGQNQLSRNLFDVTSLGR